MPEDTGAGAAPEGTAPAEGTPAPSAASDADAGGDPAEMLGAALADDGDDDDGSSDDPAKQLAAAQREAKKWRDLSRKNETAAKKALADAQKGAEAARRLAELEDKDKTESQRNAERATVAEQRAVDAEAKYHRTLAAATYGLPPSLIDRISGASEDEINESAEQLAAAINEAAEQRATAPRGNGSGNPQRPVESLRPGAIPASNGGSPNDPNALFRQLMGQR